ncbi:DUF6703 family protein [Ornithinimicrobium avium]|uniref:Uncharacterized protein n=1 Tax=Ornithinimicrobium avium TaxID=2283195 RepID=A0A345NIX7_9MICO|nr:DUF6703 family protein [Ornithinimicrobium avium]AXH94985.1 hypothetical protein DV701_01280 [Ornithinimicrobium avium]
MSTAPSSEPASSAGPGPTRRRVEQASLPALELLARLPVWLPFLVLLLLMVGGGFLGGVVGWVLVGVALAFILWLLYLSWPRLSTVDRVMRLAVLLLFVAVAVTQLVPRA